LLIIINNSASIKRTLEASLKPTLHLSLNYFIFRVDVTLTQNDNIRSENMGPRRSTVRR